MKALKVLLIILVVIIVLVGGCSYWLYRNLDGIMVAGIEAIGTDVLQTPVNLDRVDFSLTDARVEIHGLVIQNFSGFAQDTLFSLNNIAVDVDPNSMESDVVVFDEVLIDGLTLTLEQREDGYTNLQELKKRLAIQTDTASEDSDTGSAAEQAKFIIRKLTFTNVKMDVVSPLIESQSYQMEDIVRRDLGVASGGVTAAELGEEIVQPFVDQAEQLVRAKAGEEVGRFLEKNLSDQDAENLDKLQKLLNP